jgi:hypothetical protein
LIVMPLATILLLLVANNKPYPILLPVGIIVTM